jgi:hypothetical protein
MYTVGEQHQNEHNRQFNVTKSINFNQCSRIADVAYGYQTQQMQPQCAQCQQRRDREQQRQKVGGAKQLLEEEREQSHHHFCEQQQCDPKEVKEQKLSRSTVLRYVLNGDQKQHTIVHSELTSQYVFKNLNAETGQYGSAMHAIVASELIFRGAQPTKEESAGVQQQRAATSAAEKQETILYSNVWDVDEKRFYMYGDEEYGRNSPFRDFTNKVQHAEQALRKIAQITDNNQQSGIEVGHFFNFFY